MPRQDLIPIADRLKEADLLDIVRAEPVAWPFDVATGEGVTKLAYLERLEAGARIILQGLDWSAPAAFWAISADEQKTSIHQDWSPKPGDRVEANRAGMEEQYTYHELPAFIRSARWLALDVLCAIADVRHAIETTSVVGVVHPANRLGWTLCELFVLFNYGDWLDRSTRVAHGGMKGSKARKEIESRSKIVELGKEIFEKGHSASRTAALVRQKLQEAEPAGTKVPSERRIREIIDQSKKNWRKAGKPPKE